MKQITYTPANTTADQRSNDNDLSEVLIRSVITGFSILLIAAADLMLYSYLTH